MTAAFHCTDAYSAIAIFEKGLYKTEMMMGIDASIYMTQPNLKTYLYSLNVMDAL